MALPQNLDSRIYQLFEEDANGNVSVRISGQSGDVAAGTEDSGNPVKIGGVYNVTAPTLADGERGDAQLDANGNLKVTQATSLSKDSDSITAYLHGNSLSYISSATTTTAKTGAGVLHTITVTGGTAGTIIVYDNTAGSGTVIASFDSTNALATYTFDLAFSTGLTIVTAAATKVTVSYR